MVETTIAARAPKLLGAPLVRLVSLLVLVAVAVWLIEARVVDEIIKHDLSAYLAPAIALVEGKGAPYVDFFDIKPPYLVLVVASWVAIFGHSLRSMVALDVVSLSAMFLLFYKLLSFATTQLVRRLAFVAAIVVALANNHFGMMVLSETLGLLFVFAAMAAALAVRARYAALMASGFLMFAAGQTKEVYVFAPIAIGLLLQGSWRQWVAESIVFASGWIAGLCIGVAMLWWCGAIAAYIDVLSFKAKIFATGSPLSYLGRLNSTLLALAQSEARFWLLLGSSLAMLVLLRHLRMKGENASRVPAVFPQPRVVGAFALLFVALLLGFAWQGKPFKDHYAVTLWFPSALAPTGWVSFIAVRFSGGLADSAGNSGVRWTRALAHSWVILCLVPHPVQSYDAIVKDVKWRAQHNGFTLPELEPPWALETYSEAKKQLPQGACLQEAYGWNAGAAYIYTGALPCSRYFLNNLIVEGKAAEAFSSELARRPPAVIIYNPGDADLDVAVFEQQVFAWRKVIDACYAPTALVKVLVARLSGEELRECVRKNRG